MRTLLLFAAVAASSCASRRVPDGFPPEAARYLDSDPETLPLCVSQVPHAGPLKGEADAWNAAVAALSSGDLGGAGAALDGAGEHPGLASARLALLWTQGDRHLAAEGLQLLSAEWVEDPCLHQAAAAALLQLGYLSAMQLSMARGHVRDAATLAPEDPEIGYLSATLQLIEGDADGAARTLRAALQVDPDHLQAAALLGALYLDQGDNLLAIPLLERAAAGGLGVDEGLSQAYYGAGQTADYLRHASRVGLPLGDGGALAEADDPQAAYRDLLGLGGEDARLFAVIETGMGDLRCELFWRDAPVTVANFVGLARGDIEWTHPETKERTSAPIYDGTTFHRVIPQFMIQGGDPMGTGMGDPGYEFRSEISPSLYFDRPGVLAMANSGPDTNGCQFFVTEVAATHLNGGYSIFGQCDDDAAALTRKIARVPTGSADKPLEDVTIRTVRFEVTP